MSVSMSSAAGRLADQLIGPSLKHMTRRAGCGLPRGLADQLIGPSLKPERPVVVADRVVRLADQLIGPSLKQRFVGVLGVVAEVWPIN